MSEFFLRLRNLSRHVWMTFTQAIMVVAYLLFATGNPPEAFLFSGLLAGYIYKEEARQHIHLLSSSNYSSQSTIVKAKKLKTVKIEGNPVVKSKKSKALEIVLPCVTVLQSMTQVFYDSLKTEIQDVLFSNLVSLFRNDNGDIRNAVRDVLLRTNITSSTIVRFLGMILSRDTQSGSLKRMKRNKLPTHQNFGIPLEENRLSFLGTLLDILLLKKNMEKMIDLLQPLLQALEQFFF